MTLRGGNRRRMGAISLGGGVWAAPAAPVFAAGLQRVGGMVSRAGRQVVGPKNVFVGRVRQNFLRQSYIGAIVTDGNPALPFSGQTAGVDMRLATSRFLGRQRGLAAWLGLGERQHPEHQDGEPAFRAARHGSNDVT